MTRVIKTLFALTLLLSVGACDSRTEGTDGGGVILSITDWDGVPLAVSVNSVGGFLQIEEIAISNTPKNPSGVTSSLMDVEINSLEVTFTRADNGTRLPVAFVRALNGYVPVNGTLTYQNEALMGPDQFSGIPLSDLLTQNGGVDTETGRARITLNLRFRFFGRTVSGDEVETNTGGFTIDFTP